MTSVGVKIDNSVTRQSGPYCFKIQGELHHLTGALLPHGDQTSMYALKGAKETISLAQAKDVVPGPNCMLKSLWG